MNWTMYGGLPQLVETVCRVQLALREVVFRSAPAQGSLGPVSEVHGVFSNRDVTPTSAGNPGQEQ